MKKTVVDKYVKSISNEPVKANVSYGMLRFVKLFKKEPVNGQRIVNLSM